MVNHLPSGVFGLFCGGAGEGSATARPLFFSRGAGAGCPGSWLRLEFDVCGVRKLVDLPGTNGEVGQKRSKPLDDWMISLFSPIFDRFFLFIVVCWRVFDALGLPGVGPWRLRLGVHQGTFWQLNHCGRRLHCSTYGILGVDYGKSRKKGYKDFEPLHTSNLKHELVDKGFMHVTSDGAMTAQRNKNMSCS